MSYKSTMPGTPGTPPGSPCSSTPYVRFEHPPTSPDSPQGTPEPPKLLPYGEERTPVTVEATAVLGAVGAPKKRNKRIRLAIEPRDS